VRQVALVLVLAACPAPAKPAATPTDDPTTNTVEKPIERRQRWVAELQDDIIQSYDRDEPPDVDTALVDPHVGPARIGVGPGDVLVGDDVKLRASSRWPLFVQPGTQTDVRSKHLDIHLSADKNVVAAWMSDEVSWRITLCGRTAVIPLRMTALYAHDGDRWVQVFEHLSFGDVPTPTAELYGLQMRPVVVDRPLADELSHILAPLLFRQTNRLPGVVALDPQQLAEGDLMQPAPTLLIAPDRDGEWHGTDDISRAQLVDGTLAADDRRIGTIGPTVSTSTIAYWVGNFVADLAERPGVKAGKVRLRGTFVFEKRPPAPPPCDAADKTCKPAKPAEVDCANPKSGCHWVVVQGHVSKPIDDINLASIVFGTALISEKPLQITCDDGSRSVPTN
jgi:hypothetical protein